MQPNIQESMMQQQRNYVNTINQKSQKLQRMLNVPPQTLNFQQYANQQFQHLPPNYDMNNEFLLSNAQTSMTNMPQSKIYLNCPPASVNGTIEPFLSNMPQCPNMNSFQQYAAFPPPIKANEVFEVGDNRSGRGNKIFIIPNNNNHFQPPSQQVSMYQMNPQSQQYFQQKQRQMVNIPQEALNMDNHNFNSNQRMIDSMKEVIDQEVMNMHQNNMEQEMKINLLNSQMNPQNTLNIPSFINKHPDFVIPHKFDESTSIIWHRIQAQFENQINQKLESSFQSENGFIAYQKKLKRHLEIALKEMPSNTMFENNHDFIQLIPNQLFQREISDSFLCRIKNGYYEVPFGLMDRFLKLINLVSINLLLCEGKRMKVFSISTPANNQSPMLDGAFLNNLLVECDEIIKFINWNQF